LWDISSFFLTWIRNWEYTMTEVDEKLTNTGSGLSMAPNFDYKTSDSVYRKFRYRTLKFRIYESVVASRTYPRLPLVYHHLCPWEDIYCDVSLCGTTRDSVVWHNECLLELPTSCKLEQRSKSPFPLLLNCVHHVQPRWYSKTTQACRLMIFFPHFNRCPLQWVTLMLRVFHSLPGLIQRSMGWSRSSYPRAAVAILVVGYVLDTASLEMESRNRCVRVVYVCVN
jgi:hypothetical protein